jgi:uncharacterized protein (TIGR00251 family)
VTLVAEEPDGIVVAVRVVPRAGRDEVAGVRHGALLVRLAAAPVEGAANDALVRLLADRLGVPRRAITIVAGARARQKRVRIAGLDAAAFRERLAAWLPPGE